MAILKSKEAIRQMCLGCVNELPDGTCRLIWITEEGMGERVRNGCCEEGGRVFVRGDWVSTPKSSTESPLF